MVNKYTIGIIALVVIAIFTASMVSAFGFGRGFMGTSLTEAQKTEFQAQRQAMETAIQNKDYQAWKSLMQQKISEMQSQLTQENFNKIVDMHDKMTQVRDAMQEAKKTGDYSKVEELKTQLGIEGKGFMGHFGNFHNKMMD